MCNAYSSCVYSVVPEIAAPGYQKYVGVYPGRGFSRVVRAVVVGRIIRKEKSYFKIAAHDADISFLDYRGNSHDTRHADYFSDAFECVRQCIILKFYPSDRIHERVLHSIFRHERQ